MPGNVVLQTWKEISEYVGRTERTVQRWNSNSDFRFTDHQANPRLGIQPILGSSVEWAEPSLLIFDAAGVALSGGELDPTKERTEQLSLQVRTLHQKIQQIFPIHAQEPCLLEAAPLADKRYAGQHLIQTNGVSRAG